jgi:hypothetical protein
VLGGGLGGGGPARVSSEDLYGPVRLRCD